MASSLNKVLLIGNLGRDPEIRYSGAGDKIANLSVATSETWKDKQTGERRERTEWHRVVIFNTHLADVAEKFLRKGSKVYLEGALQTRKWTGNDGAEKYTTEVVLQKFRGELTMLDSQRNGPPPADSQDQYGSTSAVSGSTGSQSDPARQDPPAGQPAGGTPGGDLDDEIPF